MAVTSTTLDGWFKERYEEKARDLVPDFGIVQQDIKYRQAQKLGDKFVANVRLRRSAGYTFYGSALDAFSLNAVASGQRAAAEVQGTQFVLREQVAYGVIAAGMDSKQAFGNAFDDVVADMRNSGGFALEMMLLYGGSSIGEISSVSGSGTTRDWVLTKASWAAGLWAQFEGGSLDCYTAPGGTQRNTNAVITVTAVDPATRTVSVSGNATDLTACVATDVLIPYNADGNWADGLDVLIPNTTTMHGINAATYGQWAGNSFGAGSAALTFLKVQSAASNVLVRGGIGKLICYVSPYTWTDLNDDEAALRRHVNKAGGDVEVGYKSIDYYGVGGHIEIKAHPMVKAGEAFLINPTGLRRVGAVDFTFNLGIQGQQPRFFRELADNAGFELRGYWHQALLNCKPPSHCKITGIVDQTL